MTDTDRYAIGMTCCPKAAVRAMHLGLTVFVIISTVLNSELQSYLSMTELSSLLYIITFLSLCLVSLITYFVAAVMDPGYVPIPLVQNSALSEDDDDEASCDESKMIDNITRRNCGFCGIQQPLRAHHCEDCGRCVRRFDHHCPWLSTCVGELNHRWFLLFLVTTTSSMVWITVINIRCLMTAKSIVSNVVPLIVMLIIIFGGLVVIPLTFVHLYITAANITTWEFASSHRITYLQDLKPGTNPFHLGYMRNLVSFWFKCRVQNWERLYNKRYGIIAQRESKMPREANCDPNILIEDNA